MIRDEVLGIYPLRKAYSQPILRRYYRLRLILDLGGGREVYMESNDNPLDSDSDSGQ